MTLFLQHSWNNDHTTPYWLPEVKEGVGWEGKRGWERTVRGILGVGGGGWHLDHKHANILACSIVPQPQGRRCHQGKGVKDTWALRVIQGPYFLQPCVSLQLSPNKSSLSKATNH